MGENGALPETSDQLVRCIVCGMQTVEQFLDLGPYGACQQVSDAGGTLYLPNRPIRCGSAFVIPAAMYS